MASAGRHWGRRFLAYYLGNDAISRFHIMGPFVVMLMSGTVAIEALVLGEAASEKIGYAPNRAYQVQSGLANMAIAVTGLLGLRVELGALCGGHHRDCDVDVLHLLGGKSRCHGHHRGKHEAGQSTATGDRLVVGGMLLPMIKALT